MKKILSIAISIIFAAHLYGQSAQFLNISSDPAYYSLGGATLTADANAFTIASNASATALGTQKMSVAASYGAWQPKGMNDGVLAVSGYGLLFNRLSVGLNGKYMLHKPYDIIGNDGSIKDQFTPSDMSIELGVGYKIFRGLAIGVNLRFISSTIYEETSGSAFGADISVSYRLKGLRLALAATNLGSKIDYGYTPYNLPAMGKLGVGYALDINEQNTLSIHAEGDYLLYHNSFMAGAGLEYKYNDMIAARVGYHYGDQKSIPSYFSAGLGVKFLGITLNGAYVIGFDNSPINGSFMASLGYEF